MNTKPIDIRRPRRLELADVAGRVPPHDLDAEAVVLSAVLAHDGFDRVVDILKPEHFYSDANGRIFEAAIELSSRGQPVDIVQVAGWLRDRETIAKCGGVVYLGQLAHETPVVAHVDTYARRIRTKWRVRQLIATCQKVAAEGYGDVGDEQEFIDGAEQSVYEIARDTDTKSTQSTISAALKGAFEAIAAAAERGDRITGYSTGYEKLDAKTAGLHPGDLTIVAGRPGMGKTSLAMNMAVNIASAHEVKTHGKPPRTEPGLGVEIFSLEMPREQLVTRMACSEGRVDLGRLRQGYLQPDDWSRLTEATSYLSSLPVRIDEDVAIGLLEMRARVRRAQAERKIGLVVVDYLQLMRGRPGTSSREQEISEISRGLKLLAKELEVPVIALSQLNRAVESRGDKRPQLSDLRESGAIEQDADNVIFVYRDEVYNPETSRAKGIAELIVAKQRNGPTGKVLTRFTASCTRFDNLAPGDYDELEEGT
jgi:replicative DNA helicase